MGEIETLWNTLAAHEEAIRMAGIHINMLEEKIRQIEQTKAGEEFGDGYTK